MSKIDDLYNKLTTDQKKLADTFIESLIPKEIDLDSYCDHSSWKDYQIINSVFNSFEFKRDYNIDIAVAYDKWPAYRAMYEAVETIVDKPDRHKIIMSPDINSCLRYISFNIANDKWHGNINKVYVHFHFRSQNSVMLQYDRHYAWAIVEEFLANSPFVVEDDKIQICFIVDEFINKDIL